MAEKTILEKAAMAVGYGIAMAEDVAGVAKTAVGSAVTTVTEVLKKTPEPEAPAQSAAKPAPAPKPAAKKAAKMPAKKAVKAPAKKSAKKAAKKTASGRK
jgi:hypothetical protein